MTDYNTHSHKEKPGGKKKHLPACGGKPGDIANNVADAISAIADGKNAAIGIDAFVSSVKNQGNYSLLFWLGRLGQKEPQKKDANPKHDDEPNR